MRAHIRGIPVYWDGTNYRYTDTNALTEVAGTPPRPCPACDKIAQPCPNPACQYVMECASENQEGWMHDPCLGHLADTASACCGHGIEPGYRRDLDGVAHDLGWCP